MGLPVFTFTQLLSKAKKRCSRRALTRDPTIRWCLFSGEPDRISAQASYCQKLESLPKICAADSVCLSLLFSFHAIIFESRTVESQTKRGSKIEFNVKYHSGSLKVTHFGITVKLTTDCISLHNNTRIISKVSEEIGSKNTENCHFRRIHCRLTPPPHIVTSREYPHKPSMARK